MVLRDTLLASPDPSISGLRLLDVGPVDPRPLRLASDRAEAEHRRPVRLRAAVPRADRRPDRRARLARRQGAPLPADIGPLRHRRRGRPRRRAPEGGRGGRHLRARRLAVPRRGRQRAGAAAHPGRAAAGPALCRLDHRARPRGALASTSSTSPRCARSAPRWKRSAPTSAAISAAWSRSCSASCWPARPATGRSTSTRASSTPPGSTASSSIPASPAPTSRNRNRSSATPSCRSSSTIPARCAASRSRSPASPPT